MFLRNPFLKTMSRYVHGNDRYRGNRAIYDAPHILMPTSRTFNPYAPTPPISVALDHSQNSQFSIMPFYEVHHSYPLSDDERQSIARSITDLHCTAFKTPSFFVHIQFVAHDINDRTYYMAGKPRAVNSNRIIGVVRTSPSRTKSDFDTLAANIEDAWYKALSASGMTQATEAKRLLMVTFLPMVTIREGGMAIPEAGQEGGWLKGQLPYIRMMSEQGLEDFTDLLGELKDREDLREMIQ